MKKNNCNFSFLLNYIFLMEFLLFMIFKLIVIFLYFFEVNFLLKNI